MDISELTNSSSDEEISKALDPLFLSPFSKKIDQISEKNIPVEQKIKILNHHLNYIIYNISNIKDRRRELMSYFQCGKILFTIHQLERRASLKEEVNNSI